MTECKVREYIGRFSCDLCSRMVRVYDWLPVSLLCMTCSREVMRDEMRSEEKERPEKGRNNGKT